MRSTGDAELFSHEIAWYLQSRDAACGVRSSLGGQIEAIGRGGAKSTPTSDLYNESQSDFRSSPKLGARGRFFQDRIMLSRWNKLDRWTQSVLLAHYVAAMPEATDPEHEWKPGTHPPWVRYSKDYTTVFYGVSETPRTKFPKGVDARLSQLAGVALFLVNDDPQEKARILRACEKGNDKALAGIKRRAEAVIRAAHLAYYQIAENDNEDPRLPFVVVDMPVAELACETFVEDVYKDEGGVWRQYQSEADREAYE